MKRMTQKHDSPPGDLVYLSDRKLLNLAVQLGVRTSSIKPDVEIETSAGVSAKVPAVGQASAGASVRGERTDPGKQERIVARQLDQVIERLGGDELPDLEAGDEILEAGWFRFHRRLRFGMGSSDSTESVRALVVVDEEEIPEGLSTSGLLMTGAPGHVRSPYTSDELIDAPGSRSGSGSGYLFQWLDTARRKLEENPEADLNAIEVPVLLSDHPPRDSNTAAEMYRLFSEDRWLSQPQFPQLLHGAPCEGVAQASFIAAKENFTLVMASPLYVRVRALPDPDAPKAEGPAGGWRRSVARFFGASSSNHTPG